MIKNYYIQKCRSNPDNWNEAPIVISFDVWIAVLEFRPGPQLRTGTDCGSPLL